MRPLKVANPTSRDIAEIAGVSQATVSRALRNSRSRVLGPQIERLGIVRTRVQSVGKLSEAPRPIESHLPAEFSGGRSSKSGSRLAG